MSLIMDIITPEHSKLSALNEKSQMSLIMGPIQLEQPELFVLNCEKLLNLSFFNMLQAANIIQSTANLVNMYMTIRSQITSIMDQI